MKEYEKWLAAMLALLMLAFSLPKLLALDVSVELFERINAFLGFSGTTFRHITGILELVTGVLVLNGLWTKKEKLAGTFGLYLLGLLMMMGTMAGALVVEFAMRPGEDLVLTLLAALLFVTAAGILIRNKRYITR